MRHLNRVVILLKVAAVIIPAACADADLADGREGDAETARRYLQVGVNGDANGKFNLAIMYLMGKSVPQDYDESLRWMLEAVATAHPSASAVLSCLRTGRPGVNLGPEPRTFEDQPTDPPKLKLETGLYYWQRSCDPVDSAQAIRLLSETAAAGLPNGQYMMGIAYRQGRGVGKNDGEAAKWFGRAGAQGHLAARRAFCALRKAADLTGAEIESRTQDWCGAD